LDLLRIHAAALQPERQPAIPVWVRITSI